MGFEPMNSHLKHFPVIYSVTTTWCLPLCNFTGSATPVLWLSTEDVACNIPWLHTHTPLRRIRHTNPLSSLPGLVFSRPPYLRSEDTRGQGGRSLKPISLLRQIIQDWGSRPLFQSFLKFQTTPPLTFSETSNGILTESNKPTNTNKSNKWCLSLMGPVVSIASNGCWLIEQVNNSWVLLASWNCNYFTNYKLTDSAPWTSALTLFHLPIVLHPSQFLNSQHHIWLYYQEAVFCPIFHLFPL